MILDIRKNPDPILRQKTRKIKDPQTKEIQDLVASMLETMYSADGLGLAAPQIGQDLRLCIIDEGGQVYVLINPQITAKSKDEIVMEEGCLSFPGQFYEISRPEKVQVRYLDQHGVPRKIKTGGLLARALQHEIDHLEGKLLIDYVKKNKRKNIKEK